LLNPGGRVLLGKIWTSITVSATLDENLSLQMPFSSGTEVLWPRIEATGVADAVIEAETSLHVCCNLGIGQATASASQSAAASIGLG